MFGNKCAFSSREIEFVKNVVELLRANAIWIIQNRKERLPANNEIVCIRRLILCASFEFLK